MDRKSWLIFLSIAFLYALIQFKGIVHVGPGDENIYFYMAKYVSEGKFPYKDFFYAHPPLHILALSAIIKIFGFHIAILKTATLLFYLMSALFLYKISLELFKNRFEDKQANIISAIAVIIFLFSFEVLFKATFSMGSELSLMFLLAGFYFIFTKRYFVGGIFTGLAGLTRLYTLAPIMAIFIFVGIKKLEQKKIREFLIMMSGFLVIFGFAIALLLLLCGHNFFEPVFRYHFLKPAFTNQKITVYKNVLTENWVIFAAFLLSIFLKNKKRFQIFYFITFASILFLFLLKAPKEFYFSMAFPFMSIIGSYSIAGFIRNINRRILRNIIAVILVLIFFWNTTADIMFLERFGFLPMAPLPELMQKVSQTSQNKKIFGDDATVSLLALKTNRSIALDYIDANEMRFTSGLSNFYLFANQLDDVNLSYIIYRKNKGLHQIREFRDYAEKRCKLENEYSDIAEGVFLLYKC